MLPEPVELACPRCPYVSVCGPTSMLEWLRQAKMVRREVAPEPDLLGELFRTSAAKFTCPTCGTLGLVVRAVAEENDEEWGMARACEACGKPIARERLDIFPHTRLCVTCQAKADRGETDEPREFCPRCGNVMTVRLRRDTLCHGLHQVSRLDPFNPPRVESMTLITLRPSPHSSARIVFLLMTLVAFSGVACSPPQQHDPAEKSRPELSLAEQADAVRDGRSSHVRLDQTHVVDTDLTVLDGLDDRLRRVNFSDTEITDAGLERLCRLENLEQLRLASPRVTDAGLAHLKNLKRLRFLHLIDMPITDQGLAELHAIKTLESLYLDGTHVTDAGLARLLEALPKVHLHIDDHHHRLDPHSAEHKH